MPKPLPDTLTSQSVDVGALLRSTPLFESVSDETLTELVRSARLHTYERGAVLFLEGEKPGAVHLVISGLLRVFVTAFDGTEPTLAVLSEGTLVGELGVLGDVPRSASVGALRPCRVLALPADTFRSAYLREPALARRLVELLSDRLRSTSGSVADLAYLDLGGRLAKYLLTEANRAGTTSLTISLTQAELGQMIGGARQTVNQLLQSLERAGLIALQGRTVSILDLDGLKLRALSA